MNKLYIYDVSAVLYAGMAYSDSEFISFGDNKYKLPVGGIKLLMSRVFAQIAQKNFIALAMDSKTDKQKIFPNWKSNRIPNSGIEIQRKILLEWLPRMGFNTYHVDGIEADDIILNLVMNNLRDYSQVYIVSADADVACSILSANVSLIGAASKDRSVTRDTYENVVRKGYKIPYNTVSPFEVFYGKPSNCVGVFKCSTGEKHEDLFNDFIAYTKSTPLVNKPQLWSMRPLFDSWLKTNNLPDEDKEQLRIRADVTYSKILHGNFRIPSGITSNLDMDEVLIFLKMFNLNPAANILGLRIPSGPLPKESYEYLMDCQNRYQSGVYNVDMSLPFETNLFSDEDDFIGNVGEIE
jgi:hypothetical protein